MAADTPDRDATRRNGDVADEDGGPSNIVLEMIATVVREAQVMMMTTAVPPPGYWTVRPQTSYPPSGNPVPLVVKPPVQQQAPIPPSDNVLPTETPNVPEPASLVTGLVGSSLALVGWLRGRRRRQAAADQQAA